MTTYEEAAARLGALGPRPDLDALESTAATLERELRVGDAGEYLRFVIVLCDKLNSFDLGDVQRQDRLVLRYAEQALGVIRPQPSDTELRLLEHAVAPVPPAGAESTEWPSTRRDAATRWLEALARVEAEIDESFDPEDVPVLNLVPAETALPAGTAPEVVQDPRLRREYEQAIAENGVRITRYGQQTSLRRLLDRYRPVAEQYVVAAYARPPEAGAELRDLLERYVARPERRAALLAAVAQGRGGGAG